MQGEPASGALASLLIALATVQVFLSLILRFWLAGRFLGKDEKTRPKIWCRP